MSPVTPPRAFTWAQTALAGLLLAYGLYMIGEMGVTGLVLFLGTGLLASALAALLWRGYRLALLAALGLDAVLLALGLSLLSAWWANAQPEWSHDGPDMLVFTLVPGLALASLSLLVLRWRETWRFLRQARGRP